MRRFGDLLGVLSIGIIALAISSSSGTSAKSTGRATEDPYHGHHVGELPTEVRNAVISVCGTSARATHYFTTYRLNPQTITLHFEHSRCGVADVCNKAGCLHQVYGLTGGRYRLLKSYHSLERD